MDDHKGMYIRLADFPVPRRWWWWSLLVFLLVRDRRRTPKQMEGVGRDLAGSAVARWKQTDADTTAMLRLSKTMVRLTWAVVVLTVVVLGRDALRGSEVVQRVLIGC